MVDFSLIWDLRVTGAQAAKKELDDVSKRFQQGKASAEEFNKAIKNYEKSTNDAVKAQRLQNNEFKLAHPQLNQVAKGFSVVSGAASRLASVYNSINLALIRRQLGNRQEAEQKTRLAQIDRELHDIRTSPKSAELQRREIELINERNALTEDLKRTEAERGQQQLEDLGLAAFAGATAVSAALDIAKNWDKVTDAVKGTSKAIRGVIALTALSNLATTAGLVGAGMAVTTLASSGIRAIQNKKSMEEQLSEDVGLLFSGKLIPEDSPLLKQLGVTNGKETENAEDFGLNTNNPLKVKKSLESSIFDTIKEGADNASDALRNFIDWADKASRKVTDTIIQPAYGETPTTTVPLPPVQTHDPNAPPNKGGSMGFPAPAPPPIVENKPAPFATVTRAGAAQTISQGSINAINSKPNALGITIGGGSTAATKPSASASIAAINSKPNALGIKIGRAVGGWLTEPITGVGMMTGRMYSLAESGPEYVSPRQNAGSSTIVNNYYYNIAGSVITQQELARIVSRDQKLEANRRF